MRTTIKLLLILSFIVLSACQQAPKVQQNDSVKAISEINEILTIITIEAIKEENYEQAQRSIQAMILNNDDKTWDFIFSAITTLPNEMGLELIDYSLSKDFIKNSPSQLFGFAKIFVSYQDTKQSLKVINQAVALDAEFLDARFWRARLLTVLKEYDKAENDFVYVMKKQPDNTEYADQYASFLQETKQFDKAQEILAKQEATIDNVFRRIIFNLQAEDKITAMQLYDHLKNIEVDEEDKNNKFYLIAEAAQLLDIYHESEDYYKKVLGGDKYLDAREMLSLILYDTKKFDESKEILHQLQNAEEKYAINAYRLESQINKIQGQPEEALETLTRSLEIIPNNPILLYDRAMINESLGKLDQVEQDLLQVIKDDPNNFEALNALGYSLADHDLKLDEAYEYIKRAINLAPNNPAIIDSLAVSYTHLTLPTIYSV